MWLNLESRFEPLNYMVTESAFESCWQTKEACVKNVLSFAKQRK